ncbi:hypothetical protein Dimus_010695 [Dionaea muscipula]
MRSLSPSSLVADDRDDSGVVILVGADALTLMEEKPCTVASLAGGCEDFTQARCGDMVMADWSGEQGGEQGGASRGDVEQTSPQVRNLCSSCSEYDAITVSGPQVSAEGLDFAIGRAVMELHRAFPFPDGGTRPVVAGDLFGPNLPLSCGIVGQSDGGPVSEEVRGAPVAKEALGRSLLMGCDSLPRPRWCLRVVLRVELGWTEILDVVPMLILFRRSRRFSPPILPASSEIDSVRAPLLSPVVETLDSEIEVVA